MTSQDIPDPEVLRDPDKSLEVLGGHGRFLGGSWEVPGRSLEVLEYPGRSWEVIGSLGRSCEYMKCPGRSWEVLGWTLEVLVGHVSI